MKKLIYLTLSILIIGVSACQKENTAPNKKIDMKTLEGIKGGPKRDTVPPDPYRALIRRDTVPPDPAK